MTPKELWFGARWRLISLLLVLDCAFPKGLLNTVFYKLRWFPTNLTGLFAGALNDPSGAGGILLVSASTPLFWALLAAAAAFSVPELRRRSRIIPAALAVLFFLGEFFLPWWGEHGAPLGLYDALFPVVPRGNGRAYELVHLLALPVFAGVHFFRSRSARPPAV